MDKLTKELEQQLSKMTATGQLFRVDADGDTLWKAYLENFEEEDDPIFRDPESSVHNCNYCHNFVRRYGNLVAVDPQTFDLISLWDFEPSEKEYKKSVKAMSELVHICKIRDKFVETYSFLSNPKTPYEPGCKCGQPHYRLGVMKNIKRYTQEDVDRWPNSGIKLNQTITFNHLYLNMPKQFISFTGESQEQIIGKARDIVNVFKRGLDEISTDTMDVVIDLEAQGSLLNGVSYIGVVKRARQIAEEYKKVPEEKKLNWCWFKGLTIPEVVAKFRNCAIGTFLTDLAEGLEMNVACEKFNKMMDPTNYMKATAPITQKQIAEAEKFVEDNGYSESFERRCATLEDIEASEILHENVDAAETKTKVSVFSNVKASPSTRHKKSEFKGVEEVSIEKFMKEILPHANQVEIFLQNKHEGNFVTLLTSKNKDSKQIFKWGNNFSWTYANGLAGKSAIKQAVKAAGGFVDAPFRFSILWNDEDTPGIVDFDAHAKEPGGTEIYFGSYKLPNKTRMGGQLDIDMIRPHNKGVENIYWTDMSKVAAGTYRFWIHNYDGRRNRGCKAEIFIDGSTYTYLVPTEIQRDVEIAQVTLDAYGHVTNIKQSQYLIDSEDKVENLYGLDTGEFHKANLICKSPNCWGEHPVGNQHVFFMLEGAKSPEKLRSIHNEFLNQELLQHRKVMEVLGTTLKVESTPDQLSGLGFNTTMRDELIVRVSGSFKRVIKIKF